MHKKLTWIVVSFWWVAAAGGAEPNRLAFTKASGDEEGLFRFETGVMRGRIRAMGQSKGIIELVHQESATEVAQGGQLPGLFSFYRIFSTDTRYGDAARDWPSTAKLLPDGALQIAWPPAAEHPLELTATYRFSAPDTLDLETTVRPQKDMPQLEVFVSSYFRPGFQALVYVKPNRFSSGAPEFVAADVNPLVEGTYLMFPRDREAVRRIFDRRWEFPPSPVQWSITRWLAAPMAMRWDPTSQVAAVLMAPPHDCFAVATPYNKTPPDGVAGHYSLYLSLFGRDVGAGQSDRAVCRLIVAKGLSSSQIVQRYEAYLASLKSSPTR